MKTKKNKIDIFKKIHENILKMQQRFATYINKKKKEASLLKKKKIYFFAKNLKRKKKSKNLKRMNWIY